MTLKQKLARSVKDRAKYRLNLETNRRKARERKHRITIQRAIEAGRGEVFALLAGT